MARLKRISSKNGSRFIDVVESEDGSYMLQQFINKYDKEEERSYTVREFSGPTGKFGDLDSAIIEAERLMSQS